MRNWDVQVLDETGDVKYQTNISGTEQQAKSLIMKFEKRRKKDLKKENSKSIGGRTTIEKKGVFNNEKKLSDNL